MTQHKHCIQYWPKASGQSVTLRAFQMKTTPNTSDVEIISCIRGATKNHRILFWSSVWPLSEFTCFCYCILSKQLQWWINQPRQYCSRVPEVLLSLSCPHREESKKTVKGFWCLSTDPLKKDTFHKKRVQSNLCVKTCQHCFFFCFWRMWNRMLSTKRTL